MLFFSQYLYLHSYDWSGQIYVTGSNDGHMFVCDATVSNNFKVLGHLGTNGSIGFFSLLFYNYSDSLFSVDAIFPFSKKFFLSGNLMS